MGASEDATARVSRDTMTQTRPIGFWLRLVDQLINEQFESALADFSVSRQQWEILNVLSPGPSTLTRLNHELEPFLETVGSKSATEQLAGLISRGWVDVAFEYYELTGAGAVEHAEMHRLVAKKRTAAIAELDEGDYAITVRSLEQVARTLGWQS